MNGRSHGINNKIMAFYKSHYLKRTIDINTKFPYLEYITYIVTIVGDFSFNFH